jgi:predicted short-subunit dehydrogenase-like oxidoreductase (DUF2520 family)
MAFDHDTVRQINLIGAGRVARVLGRLWSQACVFDVQDVLARDPTRTREAVDFVGAGRALKSLGEMRPAHAWLIATPDDAIPSVAAALRASGSLRTSDIVFHCSGALPARVLGEGFVASVHPLKSFADAGDAVKSFAGTWCVAEGAREALVALKPAFEAIGACVTEIEARHKTMYHAGAVMMCNYLTALMEAGLQCCDHAGLSRQDAMAMMAPLAHETLKNVFKNGPAYALTGPIARGDSAVVARQVAALNEYNPQLAAVYCELGMVAASLSGADAGAIEAIRDILRIAH